MFTYMSPARFIEYSVKFQTLIVCYESTDIQAWDPYDNKVLYFIRNAHADAGVKCGLTNFPITSLFLNDTEGVFFTGASNGSIQAHNIETGSTFDWISLVPSGNPRAPRGLAHVTLLYEKNKVLLAAGAHTRIIQYNLDYQYRKVWPENIGPVCLGAVNAPNLMATLHNTGDLIYWKYGFCKIWSRYNVLDVHQDNSNRSVAMNTIDVEDMDNKEKEFVKSHKTKISDLFCALIFLETHHYNNPGLLLLIKSESHVIQFWNLHGFLQTCQLTLNPCHFGSVSYAIVDAENNYLFLGTGKGYVRTFLIEGFPVPGFKKKITLDHLIAIFPHISQHTFTVDDNLVSSYRAHLDRISCMVYADPKQILFTAGLDKVIRMWHLSGAFIGALGISSDFYSVPKTLPYEPFVPGLPHKIPKFLKYTRTVSPKNSSLLTGQADEQMDVMKDSPLEAEKSERISAEPNTKVKSIVSINTENLSSPAQHKREMHVPDHSTSYIKGFEDICHRIRVIKHITRDEDLSAVNRMEAFLREMKITHK